MPQKSLAPAAGRNLFENILCHPASFPISFCYDKVTYTGLSALPCVQHCLTPTANGEELNAVWKLDENMQLRVLARFRSDYGQSEYTVYFENTGKQPSKVLSSFAALDHYFSGEDALVRGILGDSPNWYAPYERDLKKHTAYFASTGGRATHVSFPYFNLVHGNGGTLISLGWAGIWDSLFTLTTSGDTHVVLHSNPTLNACLLPGESIRSGLVVLLPYSGRSDDDAMNLWREWFIQCNMPRADAAGTPIAPFTTSNYANDTGLPNSDGSISERYFTWKPTLDKIVSEGVVADFRWFDAGWYSDPAKNTVETDWWGTVGSWEMDPEKWPGDTFRESVEAFHEHGSKTLVWFEPERVTHVDDLVANYGYKKEWAIGITDPATNTIIESGSPITNNIGDPDCLKWTTDRILTMMRKNAVDLYREDNNASHNLTWQKLDREQTEKHGFPRYGVAENHSVEGHYKLWDNILAYCAENGKCTFVDSCAGGGGRNDIESLRRGIPFMRSDFDRTTTAVRLSMTSTFCRWVPFHGAATKETAEELAASVGAGSDKYIYRASYLPIFNFSEAFLHNTELDYDLLRTYLGEWKSIRHLLIRDMYVLTPWHPHIDRFGWTALAYDAPDTGESLVLAFRMEQCRDETCTVKLPFADPAREYILADADTGEKIRYSGQSLQNGITLTLPQPRMSLMYRISRI